METDPAVRQVGSLPHWLAVGNVSDAILVEITLITQDGRRPVEKDALLKT